MIEVRDLTKRYGRSTAVDGLSFQVRPGQVTGFLGPNGAGKSTTMRMILGIDRPTSGVALVDGRPYRSFRQPLHKVGALLDASAFHPGRTARDHLRAIALSNKIPSSRVTEVLGQVGLDAVAGKRAGTFSLGMKQRLGIAATLLGDPELLMFDEPVNGLDPEGVLWIRTLIRGLAAEGRTVFVSSHLMSEMESTADHLVVVGRGRLIADLPIKELIAAASGAHLIVRVEDAHRPEMISILSADGADLTLEPDGALKVAGMEAARAGALAHGHGIPLTELSPRKSSLEDAYFELTEDAVEYRAKEVAA